MTISNINLVEEIELIAPEKSSFWKLVHKPGDLYTQIFFNLKFPFVHKRICSYDNFEICDTGLFHGDYNLNIEELDQAGCFIQDNVIYNKACIKVTYNSGRTIKYNFVSYEEAKRNYMLIKETHPEFIGNITE